MILKRSHFTIEIEMISPSHHTRTYNGWRSYAGTYAWKVLNKKTEEIIASGKCNGKINARNYAIGIIYQQINFNPSRRKNNGEPSF